MAKIKITVDGKKKDVEKDTKAADFAPQEALAVRVNNELKDLSTEFASGDIVEFVTFQDEDGLNIFRHSSAHVMADAVMLLFPDARPTIGPAVEEGFYYDFDVKKPFHPDDLKKIERKMHELAKKKIPFERKEITVEEAKEMFKDNKFKLEMIEDFVKKGEQLSVYRHGDFVDLCKGPHVPHTGFIKAVKLTKIAGSYWKGDVENPPLQRVYGISFPTKEGLKAYILLKEEAAKRDHRKLGRDLDLYSFHECAPGMPFWHPKGTVIWNELLKYWREEHAKAGYEEIRTPIILSKCLWEQSGHWKHFKENMYFTKVDETDYALKPMNCPGGIQVYANTVHSYKEFPLRWAELGLVHRHELSGVLSGLFRVRSFTQDDAHVYCTKEQLKDELKRVILLTEKIYKQFGFEYRVELSTKPEKAMGDPKLWDMAEKALAESMEELGKEYKLNPGDGAFYGPKLDFHLKDALGRTWQCGTLQLDFQLPINFNLKYMGKDGTQEHQPIMLHRTIYGSIERFIGILVEHVAGKFPLWLSPEQVRVITVADRHNKYANTVVDELRSHGRRVELDDRTETIGRKIRDAQMQKVNYMIVVGDKEIEAKTINVRTRDNKVLGSEKIDTFAANLVKEIKDKR
jgi:threonyl-tRNA synthetase